MAVDKGYGLGKSRSAANSSMRQRAAAGQTPKSKKYDIKAANARMAASPLGQLAETLYGFALPVGKVKAAAAGLRAAGQFGKASAVEARIAMKDIGREIGKSSKRGSTPFDAMYVERGTRGTRFENMDNLSSIERKYGLSGQNRASREMKRSASVYPKVNSKERLGIKPKTSPLVEAYGKRKIKEESKRAKRGRAGSLLAEYLPGLFE